MTRPGGPRIWRIDSRGVASTPRASTQLAARPELIEKILRAVRDSELRHGDGGMAAMLSSMKRNLHRHLSRAQRVLASVSAPPGLHLVEILAGQRGDPALPFLVLLAPSVRQPLRADKLIHGGR